MSINFQNNISPIKILILDLFPSYSELNPTDEEIFLIFEGLNVFYELKDLLTLNKKIELKDNNHSSIIVSLVKSNNIIASGSINLKYGEQWITLNSETKKKSSMNLALSLIDCIKLKIFCEIKNINKNGKNTIISNTNHSLNLTNINNSINLTNRNINRNKQQNKHINLKISNKNINNKTLSKGSPSKVNADIYGTKRSPKVNKYNYSNQKFVSYDNNNILIKNFNSNFDSINHQNSLKKNNNPYSTINKQNIKKIDLNSSNKTRNPKMERKSPISSNYASLRTTNNFGIKKINTSVFNLNLKNKNKNSRMAPDIEIKELHNSKNLGGSPKLYQKNKLDDDTFQNSGNKTFHYDKKNIKNLNFQKNHANNTKNFDNKNNKKKQKKNSYSNNILSINYENNNNIINMNIVNNINNNQYKNINDNNYTNFNNTYGNNFNQQEIKSKLLYPSKQNATYNNQSINYIMDSNFNINKKTEFERSLNSFEDEEEKILNKTKENIKIPDKMNIYTNKRVNIKKTKPKIIKKYKEKNINSEKVITQKSEENSDYKEQNEIIEYKVFNKEKRNDNNSKFDSNKKDNEINDNIEDSEMSSYENENFERIKEDFLLLYNDNYMNNIQEDLLKLEIELFIEKMTELIQYYHNEYNNKIIEKEIIQNNYKLNSKRYKNLHKLIRKLEINKIDYEIKNFNKKNKQKNNNMNLNKTEIEMFKIIFNDKKDITNKNMLKNILNKIFGNKNNTNIKDLLNNDQLNSLINIIKGIQNFHSDNTYRKKIINFSN